MKPTVKETVLFGILGALMYASKLAMEVLPNIHILGVLVIAFTITFRKKALYPIYVFVLLLGLFNGFNSWWIPHLYLWTVLWAVTMILPKKLPTRAAPIIYMSVCAMHGFLYGTMYAPAQAIMFGLDFKGMIAWIISGLPFDIVHGVSNFFCGALIVPIIKILKRSSKA